jgi:hypothetical protein
VPRPELDGARADLLLQRVLLLNDPLGFPHVGSGFAREPSTCYADCNFFDLRGFRFGGLPASRTSRPALVSTVPSASIRFNGIELPLRTYGGRKGLCCLLASRRSMSAARSAAMRAASTWTVSS